MWGQAKKAGCTVEQTHRRSSVGRNGPRTTVGWGRCSKGRGAVDISLGSSVSLATGSGGELARGAGVLG